MAKRDRSKTNVPQSSREGSELTEEDLAGIEEHERSEAGRTGAAPRPESRAAQLTRLFYQTPEGKELRETADSIKSGLNEDDTVAVQIHVPKQFIRQTEFLEGKRADGAGVAPRPVQRVLSQIVLNELHDQLNWLVAGPARFEYYRNLWNQFCDAQGAPEEKIEDGKSAAPKGGNEEPF